MKYLAPKYVIIAFFLINILLYSILTKQLFFPNNSVVTMEDLAQAVGTQRITEGRLSGGFIYTHYKPLPKVLKRKPSKDPSLDLLSDSFNDSDNSVILSNSKTSSPVSRGVVDTHSNNFLQLNSYIVSYSSVFTKNYLAAQINERGEETNSSDSNLKIVATPEFKNIRMDAISADAKIDSAETSHVRGVIYFLEGKFDLAIEFVEKALTKSPNNATILNDLAILYLVRAENEEKPYDLIQALSTIDSAIRADSKLLEARFNRALILEKVRLLPSARKYWEEYLFFDQTSDWAKEARSHIFELNKPLPLALWPQESQKLEIAIEQDQQEIAKEIITKFPHSARMHVINQLLVKWVELASTNQHSQASKVVKAISCIGEVLVQLQSDELIQDIATKITKITQENNPQKLQSLIEAYQAYYQGKRLLEKRDVGANILLDKAIHGFQNLDDKAGICLSLFEYIRVDILALNYNDAFIKAQKVSFISKRKYIFLLGKSRAAQCLVQLYQTHFSQALLSQKKALNYLLLSGDAESLAMSYLIGAGILEKLGLTDEIWSYQYEALNRISYVPQSSWYAQVISWYVHVLTKLNETRVALYFQNENISLDLSKEKLDLIPLIFIQRSFINYKLGDYVATTNDLYQAKQYCSNIPNDSVKNSIKKIIELVEANYLLGINTNKAIELFNDAIKFFSNSEYTENLGTIYLSRAKAHLKLKNYTQAEIDLRSSIESFETQRSNVSEERFRVSFFQSPQEAYEEMIKFQISFNKNPSVAFNYAEKARGRALLDLINKKDKESITKKENNSNLSKAAAPFSIEQIQNNLPKDTFIIQYSLLDDCLITWLITYNKVYFVESKVNKDSIDRLIKLFRGYVEKPQLTEDFSRPSESLYEILIKPISIYLPNPEPINKNSVKSTSKIIIIPDKSLYLVPFAALINKTTKHYLIEDYTISVNPSSTIFIKSLLRDKNLIIKDNHSLLAVGNPLFDRETFPKLSNLLGAEREVEEIVKLYKTSQKILKDQATPSVFLKNAGKYTTIHFAGHAIMDISSPLDSQLVFAPEKTNDKTKTGSVYAKDIYEYQFNLTRLVILSACQTANGQLSKGEGVSSLARPFLASGVPMVLASLWNADDFASAQLLVLFHKHRVSGKDTSFALRLAQLSLLKDPNQELNLPSKWALFVLIGGEYTT